MHAFFFYQDTVLLGFISTLCHAVNRFTKIMHKLFTMDLSLIRAKKVRAEETSSITVGTRPFILSKKRKT